VTPAPVPLQSFLFPRMTIHGDITFKIDQAFSQCDALSVQKVTVPLDNGMNAAVI